MSVVEYNVANLLSRIGRLEERVENHQEELVATHSLLGSMMERMDRHGLALALDHECFFALVDLVDRQAERIARLEQILGNGNTAEVIELRSQLMRELNGNTVNVRDWGPPPKSVQYLVGVDIAVENDPISVRQAELDDPRFGEDTKCP